MKIIQFQAMPNDATWQGVTLCLCDDGNLYAAEWVNDEMALNPYVTVADNEREEHLTAYRNMLCQVLEDLRGHEHGDAVIKRLEADIVELLGE